MNLHAAYGIDLDCTALSLSSSPRLPSLTSVSVSLCVQPTPPVPLGRNNHAAAERAGLLSARGNNGAAGSQPKILPVTPLTRKGTGGVAEPRLGSAEGSARGSNGQAGDGTRGLGPAVNGAAVCALSEGSEAATAAGGDGRGRASSLGGVQKQRDCRGKLQLPADTEAKLLSNGTGGGRQGRRQAAKRAAATPNQLVSVLALQCGFGG